MKNSLLSLLAGLCLLSSIYEGAAQDIHFSHIYATPTLLNPSTTGLFDGDLRLIADTRSQWSNISGGYKTVFGSADMKLFRLRGDDFIGAGLELYADQAGSIDFKTKSANLNLSLIKSLDGQGYNYLAFGVKGAMVSNSVDYSKIEAFDTEPAAENGMPGQLQYFDLSTGLTWFHNFNTYSYMHLGGSIAHINRPDVSFFENPWQEDGLRLYRRITLHGGGDFVLNRKTSIKPSFLFMDQGPHREITVGSFVKYNMFQTRQSRSLSSLYFGAWIRWYAERDLIGSDALIAALRFDYKMLYITFTFDINISSLTPVSNGLGGPELSIVKTFDFKRSSRNSGSIPCPDF